MPMIKIFTQNDLIRFLYHETTEDENREINRLLQHDPELMLQLQELQLVVKNLDETHLEPSKGVVDRILDYAKHARAK